MKIAIRAACALAIAGAAACGGPPAASPTGEGTTFAQQAGEGAKLYADKCASCHGANGEGGDAPRVVGLSQGALPLNPSPSAKYRKGTFHTAADVAGFVVKAMPPDAPGSLSEAQYWAILAFDLKANGVDLGNKHLDATSAPTVVVHP
ncbi:MAG TPA: cytochrome c [Polyangiaceae bacterium]|jgi:cytochrome c